MRCSERARAGSDRWLFARPEKFPPAILGTKSRSKLDQAEDDTGLT
jgi:hypothetical protein